MLKTIKYFLFLTALTPFIITWSTVFPFILGKTIFFRSVIEIALILFLIYLAVSKETKSRKLLTRLSLQNPLFITILLFFLSLIISTIFAENSYRAFWGDLERGEGLFGMLHVLAFLIMAVLVFEKKDWINFLKISLIVGFAAIFYAILQYFGVKSFPFALAPDKRPISYIGNPAFVATHMFFLLMFAAIVFFELFSSASLPSLRAKRSNLIWKYFSSIVAFLSVITIFLTGVRGAILGLAAGIFLLLVYFTVSKEIKSPFGRLSLRKLSLGLLIACVAFAGIFWFTRSADLWQNVPGLNRLAKTNFLDVSDPSTQTRLITWKLSWNAFKERPLFGWGPENYLVAYEKYYDPEYATYGETWLDRAHNKLIDVLVMQGIFGLLAYLGIFATAFYTFFIRRPKLSFSHLELVKDLKDSSVLPQNDFLKIFLFAALISYFIQNLFVFDQIISYMTFFAVLGYVISETNDQKNQAFCHPELVSGSIKKWLFRFRNKFGMTLIEIIAIIALVYSLYFYNLVPYIQARLFKASPGISDNVDVVMDYLKKAMYPYNFAQYNIRGTGVDTIYLDQFFYRENYVSNPKFRPLGNLLISAMDEVVQKEPYDIRVLIREVEMLNGISRVSDDKEALPLFEKAEKLMREAAKRAPNRQEVYYHMAFNLAGQGRYQEAIDTAKYAISLNPKAPRSYYHLALVATIAGKNSEALDALAEIDKIDPDLKNLMLGDKDATLLIYNLNNRNDKVAEIIIKSLNRGEPQSFDRKYYEAALRYFALKHDAENFVKAASFLKQFPDLKDDMEILIDLAEKGNWGIIENL